MSMISVETLRSALVASGMTREQVNAIKGKQNLIQAVMARGINTNTLHQMELRSDTVATDDIESINDVVEEPLGATSESPKKLQKFSKEWNSRIMTMFAKDELFPNPMDPNQLLPNINGLRRVGHDMLPDIVFEGPVGTQHMVVDGKPWVSVMYKIAFGQVPVAQYVDINRLPMTEVCAVGDCWVGNAPNGEVVYAAALAETRAENRVWKKALGLTIPTFEEVVTNTTTKVDVSTDGSVNENGAASEVVKIAIRSKCVQLGIDVGKLLQQSKYNDGSTLKSLDSVTVKEARDILQELNSYQGSENTQSIPKEILQRTVKNNEDGELAEI